MVFSEEGLKGEIETTLPIEKIVISNQGIVSVLLRNETSPTIMTYDATGNILAEMQISTGTTGYPTAMACPMTELRWRCPISSLTGLP